MRMVFDGVKNFWRWVKNFWKWVKNCWEKRNRKESKSTIEMETKSIRSVIDFAKSSKKNVIYNLEYKYQSEYKDVFSVVNVKIKWIQFFLKIKILPGDFSMIFIYHYLILPWICMVISPQRARLTLFEIESLTKYYLILHDKYEILNISNLNFMDWTRLRQEMDGDCWPWLNNENGGNLLG